MTPRPVLGMEWLNDGLRVVEATLEHGGVTTQRLIEKDWSFAVASVHSLAPNAVVSFLTDLVAAHGWQGCGVLLALPRHWYLAHWDSDLMTMEKAQPMADEWLPSPVDQFDWSARTGDTGFLAAITKKNVASFHSVFNAAGLRLLGIAPLCEGYASTLSDAAVSSGQFKRSLILDVGSHFTEMAVLNQASCRLARTVSLDLPPTSESSRVTLINEIKSGMAFVDQSSGPDRLQRIVLIAKNPWPNPDVEALKAEFGTELQVTTMAPPVAAAGLLRAYGSGTGFWLLSPHRAEPGWRTFLRKNRSTVMAAASLFFVGLGLTAQIASEKAGNSLLQLAREVQKTRRNHAENILDQSGLPDLPDALTRLIRAVPPKCHLLDVSLDGQQKQISVRGRAADYRTVSAYARALTVTSGFARLENQKSGLIDVGGQSVIEFSLTVPL